MNKYTKDDILITIDDFANDRYVIKLFRKPNILKLVLSKYGILNLLKLAEGTLAPFPGCCGISILTDVQTSHSHRNKGLAKIIVDEALNNPLIFKTSCVVATVNNHTPEMHHILRSAGFNAINKFNNSKTSNDVTVYSYNYDKTN